MKTKLFMLLLSIFFITITACEKGPIISDQKPTADFNFSGNEIDSAYATVKFANTSIEATSYLWTLTGSDIGSSTEKNPVARYSQAGTYDVTLECSNANGTSKKTVTIEITDKRGLINIYFVDQNPDFNLIRLDITLFGNTTSNISVTNDTCHFYVPKKYIGKWATKDNLEIITHFSNGGSHFVTFQNFIIGSIQYPATIYAAF